MSRATVVLPVPGLPMNTMCRDMGGTGRPFSLRRVPDLHQVHKVFDVLFHSVQSHKSLKPCH